MEPVHVDVAGRFLDAWGNPKMGYIEFFPRQLWKRGGPGGEMYATLNDHMILDEGQFICTITVGVDYDVITPVGNYRVRTDSEAPHQWLTHLINKATAHERDQ